MNDSNIKNQGVKPDQKRLTLVAPSAIKSAEAFEAWIEAELATLETRFSNFVTRDSLCGSLKRNR